MEKNHIIGFILIFATLILFNMVNAPSEEELAERKRIQDSIALVEADPAMIKKEEVVGQNIDDEIAVQSALDSNYIAPTQEQVVTLQNSEIKLDFSSKGGFITEATLLQYKNSYDHERELTVEEMELVKILNDERNVFSNTIKTANGNVYQTSKLDFVPKVQGNKLAMTATLNGGGSITYNYELKDDYKLQFDIDVSKANLAGPIDLMWSNYMPKLERGDLFEQRYTSVYFKKSEDDDPDYCSCTADDDEEMIGERLDWVSHSNQFFNSTLSARSKPFSGGVQKTVMIDLEGSNELKRLQSDLTLDFAGNDVYQMEMYIGPNQFEALSAFDKGLEQIIPYGSSIFGSINRWVVRPFFDFLSGLVNNKGIVILIMIFLIKMLLYPLLYKMLYSQAKMGALKPELAGLKDKFKDEPQKIQMETMKVYQQYGVSPLSGCMPMVIQMPIWVALYRFFPANIDFRQESFLWSSDLSSYDAFFKLPFEIPFMGEHLSLFTILWAIATVIYTYYNSKHMDMSANPAMKYVQYFMPLMFLGFFNSYASGLTAYMFFSTLINIIQVLVTKKFIFDEDKIRKELMKEKAKPKKKKGSFQSRLEEAMKQQQQVQAQRKKGKK